MKILINCSNNIGGGGAQVAVSFINECKNHLYIHFIVVLGVNTVNDNIERGSFPNNFTFIDTGVTPWYKLHKKLNIIEKETRPDIVFTVFGPAYWRPSAKHIIGFAQGYYIYPESPFWKTNSKTENFKIWLKKQIHLHFFSRDGDAFICETEDARLRLQNIIKNKSKSFYFVSNTCSKYYFEHDIFADKLPKRRTGEFRLLTISKLYAHKNIHQIPMVIDKLLALRVDNIHFVLTISKEEYNEIFEDKYKSFVTTVGAVANKECPSLYKECDAMYLPTLLECFTASYPESMVMKKPILTSDLPFARMLCKDAALYFNPLNHTEIAEKIVLLQQNQELQNKLVKNGLKILTHFPSASERAEKYIEICNKL
ncbi:MAG: glycosyltransferase [Phocaeicola sp.]